MKVLIAPNALKGSLSAKEAATVIAGSLPDRWEKTICPIADGGDGTLECFVEATHGMFYDARVTGPLALQKVDARWGTLGTTPSAIIEMAEASGLRLLARNQYSPGTTTTFGVGELIRIALDAGFRSVLVGLGGSATNDGGTGCARALGVRFLDSRGDDLPPGGIHLEKLYSIDVSGVDERIKETEFVGLADVNNILLGPHGATHVYASQKGASNSEIKLLEHSLSRYAEVLRVHTHDEIENIPGSGAAGGLGACLIAFCSAKIVSGVDYFLNLVHFDELLHDCDMVLTAEGTIDEQTLQGKGIAGIAHRAQLSKIPVDAFVGQIGGDASKICEQLGLRSIQRITPIDVPKKEAFIRVREMLKLKVEEFVKTFE